MRGRHKKPVANNIEPIVTDEPMPDDAVLPADISLVAEGGTTTTEGAGSEGKAAPGGDPMELLKQDAENHKRA